jgi:cyclic pyranopterin monophosphate synthase
MSEDAKAAPGAPGELTHIDESGRGRMVDVSEKTETRREAVATADLEMAPETLARIRGKGIAKGDVLGVAQVAAIAAVKRTAELVPMCHPLRVTGVDVSFTDAGRDRLRIEVTVRALDRTGVEMEAMTGASVAALTVYDMVKAIDRGIVIGPIQLESKSGGKTGQWRRA